MNDQPSPGDFIEQIMQTAKSVLPSSIGQDVRDNLKAAIQDAVSELDIVTREEFDIQKQVLMRTRLKLEKIEEDIRELGQ